MSAADEPEEAAHVAGLEPGDTVLAEDKDGDEHRAIVAVIRDERAGEHRINMGPNQTPIMLRQYWSPLSIGAEEPVVGVRYVKGVDYDGTPLTWNRRITDYPASRVSLVEIGGVDR